MPLLDATDLANIAAAVKAVLPSLTDIMYSVMGGRRWFVTQSGNDSTGDGSHALPFLTIGKAVSSAASYDSILVGPGTYDELVVFGTKALTLEGIVASTTILTNSNVGGYVPVTASPHSRIRRLSFTTALNTYDDQGITGNLDYAIVEDCIFTGLDAAICPTSNTGTIIRNCHNVSGTEACFAMSGGHGWLIEHCSSFINIDTASDGWAVGVSGIGSGLIRDCSFDTTNVDGTAHDIWGVVVNAMKTTVRVENCRLYQTKNSATATNIAGISVGNATARVFMQGVTISVPTSGSGTIVGTYQTAGAIYDQGGCEYSSSYGVAPTVLRSDDRNQAALAVPGSAMTLTQAARTAFAQINDSVASATAGSVMSVAAQVGSASVTITPILANSSNPRYSSMQLANIAAGSAPTDIWTLVDSATGDPINLLDKSLVMSFATVGCDDSLTYAFEYSNGEMSVGGYDDNQLTIHHDPSRMKPGKYRVFLWDNTSEADPIVLVKANLLIEPSVLPLVGI